MMAPSPLTRTLPTLVVAVLALLPAACSGEDDGWTDIQEEPQQQKHQWFVEPEQFDQWVFQNAQSVKGQQQEFETKLNLTIELLDQSCELTDEQKLKIRLAGEMEIQRFFIRYQKVKQFYIETKPDQNDVNEIWQMIQPLQRTAQAGLFGEGSLVKRVTRETLAENQLRVHRRVEKEQRDFRYRALVEMYVMMLDEHVPLTATQRDGLLKLLVENTRPPNVFGQTDQYYILHQVSTVPRHNLEEVFDGPVGEAVWTALQMGKGYKGHLESQGVHPYVEEVE